MSKIPQGEWNAIAARYQNGESISKIARSYGCTPPAIHYILKRNRQRPAQTSNPATVIRAMESPEQHPPHTNTAALVRPNTFSSAEHPRREFAAPTLVRAGGVDTSSISAAPRTQPLSQTAPGPAPSPSVPGLDSELHLRAEAAIELFRSSFDAALNEGSPGVCEKLRQAANDLMRVAARTTMVLDRLNSMTGRSGREHNYPRSAHAGDDFGKLG